MFYIMKAMQFLRVYVYVDNDDYSITDPPPPPRNIYLRSFNQSELTFAWDTVLMSCIAVHYTIIANRSCGLCPSTTPNTFISCTNPIISGDTCRFSVLPVVCGNVNGNESKPLYVSPRGKLVILMNYSAVIMYFY